MARLGLGLAALGRPGYLNLGHGAELGDDRSVAALRARTFEVLDFAYAQGIRDFDVARSYGRGEEFLGEWLRAHNPARRDGQLEVGLRLHRGLASRARPARGQAPRPLDLPASAGRDAREPRRVARALPDPLGHARERRTGQRRGADRAAGDRPAARDLGLGDDAGRDDRPGADDRALRRGAGDLEPARASGRRGAGPRGRRGVEGDRQGGAGQRPAGRAGRRGAGRRAGAAVGDRGPERRGLGRGPALQPARPWRWRRRARSTN